MTVAELGIKVDSSGAVQATRDLGNLAVEAGKTEAATQKMAQSTTSATSRMRASIEALVASNERLERQMGQSAGMSAQMEATMARLAASVDRVDGTLSSIGKQMTMAARGTAEFKSEASQAGNVIDIYTRKAREMSGAQDELRRRIEETAAAMTRAAAAQAQINGRVASNSAGGVTDDFGQSGRERDIAAYGTELDRLRTKYVPLAAAQQQYKATLDEINIAARVGALSEAERAASIQRTKDAFATQVREINGINDNFTKSNRLASHEVGNLAAQISDIGVSLASGQSPFMVMVQQGSQVQQIMGDRGVGSILPALGAGLVSLINPTTLVLGGMLALGAGAIYAFDAIFSGAKDAEEVLAEHERLLKRVKDAYDENSGAATKWTLASKAATGVEMRANIDDLKKVMAEASDSFLSGVGSTKDVVGFGDAFALSDADALKIKTQYKEFSGALEEFYASARNSRDLLTLRDRVGEIGQAKPALQGAAAEILKLGDSADASKPGLFALAESIVNAEAALAILNNTATDAQRQLRGLKTAAQEAAEASAKIIDGLNRDLSRVGNERDQFIGRYTDGLSAATSPEDIERIRKAAAALYDQNEALRQNERAAREAGQAQKSLYREAEQGLKAVSDRMLQKDDPLAFMRKQAEELQKQLNIAGGKLDEVSRRSVETRIDELNHGFDRFADNTKKKVDDIGQQMASVFGGVFDDLFTKADAGFDGMFQNLAGGFAKMGTRSLEQALFNPQSAFNQGLAPLLGGPQSPLKVDVTSSSARAIGDATAAGTGDALLGLLTPQVGQNGQSMGFFSSPAGAGLAAGLSGFGMGYQSQSPMMGATGGALSGLIAGAPGGPLGMAVGAIIGGLAGGAGGLLGGNAAKKQQRAEAEKQYQQMLPEIGLQRQSWLGDPQGSLNQQITQIIADRDNAARAAYNAGRPIVEWLGIIQDSEKGIARAKESFRASFFGMIDALDRGLGSNSPFAAAQANIKDLGEQLKGFVSDTRAAGMTASETALAQEASRNAAISLLKGAEQLSAVQTEMQRIDGTAAGLGEVLRDLGMSADEAAKAVSEGVTAAMDKLRTSFSDDLTSRLNDAQGNGYLNDISELVKRRQTDLADAQSLGIDPALVDKVFSAEAQKVVDGAELAGDALVELVARFPELKGAVTDFLQAADPSRLLGYQDRLFAAQSDQTTLEGQLAMLDRQFARERQAEAERGGAYMVDLELAQAQERANVVKEWGKRVKEEEQARYQETMDFLEGQRRRISEWVDTQSQGSTSPLSPADQLAAADQQFSRQFALAQSGEPDAMSGITEYASRLLEAAREQYASGAGYQAIYDRVMAQMRDLGDVAPEDEFASVIAAINALLPKFDALDTSVNGLLSFDEFKLGMSGSESELKKIYTEIDTNGDGQISALELIRAATAGLAPKFDTLDKSVDGLLSFDEFKKGMKGSEDSLKDIFDTLDLDGDAYLSKLELVRGQVEGLLPQFNKLDKSVNGLLDYDEFTKGMSGSEETLKEIFTELDANGDGQLTELELINGSILGLLPKFDTLDTSVDGVLTFDEFKVGMAGSEATLSSIFTTIDENGDSKITKLEAIRAATKGLPTSFKTLDTSVNGLLSFDEFKKGMKGSEDSLKDIFDTLDLDGDAQLSEMELAREKIEALLPKFETLDTSINGLLDFDEFAKGMTGSEDSLTNIFNELDTNGDKQITRLELINGSVKSLITKFDGLDLDSSGGLSYTEFTRGMAGSEATLKSIFKELDGNGNGQLEKLELIKSYSFGTLDAAGNQSDILEDIAKIQDAANSLTRSANTFLDSIDGLQGTLVQISKDQKIFMWAVSKNTASIANFTAGDGNAYGIVINKPQEAIDAGYATGGWISGPGTGTSDTAGRFALSDGEFVVREAVASRNLWLEDFNRTGNFPMQPVPVMAPMPVYAAANNNAGPSYAELVAEVKALRQELARNTAVTASGSEAVRKETAGTRAETAGLREETRAARRAGAAPVGRGRAA